MLRRKLYLQIYFTIIASLLMVVVITGLLWSSFGRDHFNREVYEVGGRLINLVLPPADAPLAQQRDAVMRVGTELNIDITLFDAERQLIAARGNPSQPPPENAVHGTRYRMHGPSVWALAIPDGRWLVVDFGRRGMRHPLLRLALFLGGIALGVGLIAYPFVRRLTRRLEELQKGVERVGAGDLSARIEVKGRDEVAALATSFNAAAEKIETLINSHRLLLANASHELRTPLSRIRMGLTMLKSGKNEKEIEAREAAIEQDIAELDTLIDEILLMSRLDAGSYADLSQKIDLVAVVAEECARIKDCRLVGSAPEIFGDVRLLHQMVRNLIENAAKHGVPPIIVNIFTRDGSVIFIVSDKGEGIAEIDRDHVFQPFYRGSAKQNVNGYGLGLPLVRQIAEAHGGSVEIVPRQEERSAVRVILPA